MLSLREGIVPASLEGACGCATALGTTRWLACGRGVADVARGSGEGVVVMTGAVSGGSAMLERGVGTALGVAVVRGEGRVAKGSSGSTGPCALGVADGVGAGGS